MEHLERKLAHLPRRPGVYVMTDRRGKVLYVGKAKRLDHRVRSHWNAGGSVHPKQAALLPQVHDVETIVTDSDVEALLLEMTLIKEKRPPYNIRLKDDKRFPFLKITVAEPYPKPIVTRRTPRDGSRYFGPYTDAGALRRTLKMVRSIFPIRSCMGDRPGRGPRYRECLDYHIHRCAAPCIGKISPEEYRVLVDRLVQFLSGKGEEVVEAMRDEMGKASEALDYEKAARLRDRIRSVERLMRRQKMLDSEERDLDVFAFARDSDASYGVVLQVRGGKVTGKERRRLAGTGGEPDADVMAAFLAQYYRDRDTPRDILAATEPAGQGVIESWLAQKADTPPRIRVPHRGRLAGLARLAEENARFDLEEARGGTRGGLDPAVYALQKALGLKSPPVHVEGFDISNIQSEHTVASVVVFRNGKPDKQAYRKFRMRREDGPNDVAMMAEVVGRRAARIVSGEFPTPDLLLIDGGRGQVGAALTALEQEGLQGVPLVGLAKREEEIVIPGRPETLRLPRSHPGLKLLIRVRDEAHRFAIRYHRVRRAKGELASPLDGVPGIGPRRKMLLFQTFGSLDALLAASVEDVAAVPGIGRRVAERILAHFRGGEGVPGAA